MHHCDIRFDPLRASAKSLGLPDLVADVALGVRILRKSDENLLYTFVGKVWLGIPLLPSYELRPTMF
ncbi:hypothetical protein FBZ83_104405 [Azospirillum brasilense]|uniref:Uncharacterized protein n=1 Tax=Azospirillum brasilense TaxID=192 RepID=A0A560CJV3_AZOBR|nr:hypothetical protein FBZ83_104405 [Azospirillum brasilense]